MTATTRRGSILISRCIEPTARKMARGVMDSRARRLELLTKPGLAPAFCSKAKQSAPCEGACPGFVRAS